MGEKISSGTIVLDSLLKGGYEKDIITTVYGPSGTGKTCLCILAAIGVARAGKKIIYIDTEGGFSVERVKQLCDDYENVLEKMIFFNPTSFKEQIDVFKKLDKMIRQNIGLVVVDTIAMLYRVELGSGKEVYETNKELGRQVSKLNEISRKKNIPILVTNQVYANFEEKGKVNMVGGDILKYWSKCLVELQNVAGSRRKVILKKHRNIEGSSAEFIIKEKGIYPAKKQAGFKLF